MVKKIHINFTIASYFIFLMGGLGLIKYFYYPILKTEDIAIAIFNLACFIGFGILVSKGYSWTFYILVVLSFFIIIDIHSRITYTIENPNLISLIVLLQRVLIVLSTLFLLFVVPKSNHNKKTNGNEEVPGYEAD